MKSFIAFLFLTMAFASCQKEAQLSQQAPPTHMVAGNAISGQDAHYQFHGVSAYSTDIFTCSGFPVTLSGKLVYNYNEVTTPSGKVMFTLQVIFNGVGTATNGEIIRTNNTSVTTFSLQRSDPAYVYVSKSRYSSSTLGSGYINYKTVAFYNPDTDSYDIKLESLTNKCE